MAVRQTATISSAQKNEAKSKYTPMGGVPGAAARKLVKAKIIAASQARWRVSTRGTPAGVTSVTATTAAASSQ